MHRTCEAIVRIQERTSKQHDVTLVEGAHAPTAAPLKSLIVGVGAVGCSLDSVLDCESRHFVLPAPEGAPPPAHALIKASGFTRTALNGNPRITWAGTRPNLSVMDPTLGYRRITAETTLATW